jgi:hypothetical protein
MPVVISGLPRDIPSLATIGRHTKVGWSTPQSRASPAPCKRQGPIAPGPQPAITPRTPPPTTAPSPPACGPGPGLSGVLLSGIADRYPPRRVLVACDLGWVSVAAKNKKRAATINEESGSRRTCPSRQPRSSSPRGLTPVVTRTSACPGPGTGTGAWGVRGRQDRRLGDRPHCVGAAHAAVSPAGTGLASLSRPWRGTMPY